MNTLETIEWCHFWWEQANQDDKPRVLLIGDSITRGYQPFVSRQLEDRLYVSMVATSKAVDHPDFQTEMQYGWSHGGYTYSLIHWNNGLHGWHLSAEAYKEGLKRQVEFILSQQPSVKLVLALSTPVWIKKQTERLNQERNDIVQCKNEAVIQVAEQYALSVNDLYTAVVDHPEYRTDDGVHYNERGKRQLGEHVTTMILSCL